MVEESPKPAPRSKEAPEPRPAPAPLDRRLIAFVIDLLPAVLFYYTIGGRSWLGAALLYVIYHGVLTAATERTLGKVLMRLRVRQPARGARKWIFAFLRPAGYVVSTFLVLGIVQMILDRRHRAWHDTLFDSEVVWVLGEGSSVGLLRRLDRWSEQLDDTIEALLARWSRIRRLVTRALEVSFGIAWLTGGLDRVGAAIRPYFSGLIDRIERITALARSHLPGLSGVPTGATSSAAAGTASTAATLVATGLLTGVALTIAPEALRPWVAPTVEFPVGHVSGRRIVVMADRSGSMGRYSALEEPFMSRLRDGGLAVHPRPIGGPGVATNGADNNLLHQLQAFVAGSRDADAVFVFSDFRNEDNQDWHNPEGFEMLRKLLGDHSLRFYLASVAEPPPAPLRRIAEDSGGGLIGLEFESTPD